MKSPCVLAEFQVERLMRGQPRIVKSKSPSRFPRIERDLAFLMPKNLPVGDVTAEIRKSAGATLVGLKVFDVYEGDKLNQGERSVAFRLTYQGNSQTLTDDQILDLQNKVINSVGRKFSISVR